MKRLAIILTLFLAACGGDEHSDLKQELNALSKDLRGRIDPLPVVKPYERLLKSGLVEIEALAFIRGRSIARRFFILDEAQQLTPHEVKTVITRISEGSKIILIGDPAQIDNPYVDARSNGLVYCHNRMKGQALAAHVKLMKGERSKLAELAADLL